MGDFNARLGKCAGPHEAHIIGNYTFQPETANLENITNEVEENRTLFLQHVQNTAQIT